MIKYFLLLLISISCFSYQKINDTLEQTQIIYPETRTVLQEDDYHGTNVKDPYRWLEDIDSEEVLNWTYAQQSFTESYLNKIPFIDKIEDRLKERWDYSRMSMPFHRGNRYFFYQNTGLQNHSVLFYKDGIDGEKKIVLDPNLLSEDGS